MITEPLALELWKHAVRSGWTRLGFSMWIGRLLAPGHEHLSDGYGGAKAPVRTRLILEQWHRGATFKEIHLSYQQISYGRVVEIAANARKIAYEKAIKRGQSIAEVANYFGVSQECLVAMLEAEQIPKSAFLLPRRWGIQ